MSYNHCCFMGAPGVGKGTQARQFSQLKQIKHISTGDLLRESMDKKHPIGLQAQEYVHKGLLVPDDLMVDLVEDVVSRNKKGFILDGFPRNLNQARSLDIIFKESGLKLEKVFLFELPEEQLVRRLTGRRMAPQSGRIYHVEFSPPKNKGFCDESGELLVQREDDKEEVVRLRLKEYQKQQEPITQYYKEKLALEVVSAEGSPKEVKERILKLWP